MDTMEPNIEIDEPKRRKRMQMRLPFCEPDSVMDWVKCYLSEDAFIPRCKPKPTTAEPGSPEKMRVLMERVERGEELWHEEDKRKFWENTSFWNALPWTNEDEN